MKAVIFDMDGVLIDSEKLHQEAEIKSMNAHGMTVTVEDLKPYAGASRAAFRDGFDRLYQRKIDWKAIFEMKDRLFTELMQNVQALPHVLDFIPRLHERGFKLAIATSSQRYVMEFVIKRFGLDRWLHDGICGNDITRSKPDPEIFLLAAQRLGIDPGECIVFEDSINGLNAANAAGMHTIGITTTFRREELTMAGRVIDSFAEMQVDDLLEIEVG